MERMERKAKFGLFFKVLVVGILLFATQTKVGADGYQRIDGNPLRIDSYDEGTLGVYRYQDSDYVEQYYNGNCWGSVLFLNGVDGLGFGSVYFGMTGFTLVSNTMPDAWTIVTVFDAGTTGVRITQTITYTDGNAYYKKKWQIENTGSETYTDCRFLHGGDTYFAGDDDSEGHWDGNLGMVYLTNPDPALSGIMGFYGDLTTPADHYYEDGYWDVHDTMITGELPDTVHAEYIDAGYALQWNRNPLAPGETWTITSYEKWTEAGFVQVFAPADQEAAAGEEVSYEFVVANYQGAEDTFDLTLASSHDWTISFQGGTDTDSPVTLGAGASTTVDVVVTVPAGTTGGATDVLTLTATSETDTSIINSDSVTTTVTGEIPITPTGTSSAGILPVGPLAAGISALLVWWKRRKQE